MLNSGVAKKKPAVSKKPAPRIIAPQTRRRPLAGFAVVLVLGAGLFAWRLVNQPAASLPPEQVIRLDQPTAPAPGADPAPIAATAPVLNNMPAKGDLPPLPVPLGPPSRSPQVVQAVYEFAARHPEVLNYVPCFCGCERDGHEANEDCFVSSRDAEGNVQWDAHAMT